MLQKFLHRRKVFKGLPVHIRQTISALRAGDVCVDCGANVGDIADLFAGYGATVHAFEPDPVPFALLTDRARRSSRILPIPSAVGPEAGRTRLYLHKDREQDAVLYSTGSSLMDDKPNVSEDFVEVEVVDLPNFLRGVGRVKILKIDIEGYETVLLPRLVDTGCLDSVDTIYVETHEHKWPSLVESTREMKARIEDSPYRGRVFFDWP